MKVWSHGDSLACSYCNRALMLSTIRPHRDRGVAELREPAVGRSRRWSRSDECGGPDSIEVAVIELGESDMGRTEQTVMPGPDSPLTDLKGVGPAKAELQGGR